MSYSTIGTLIEMMVCIKDPTKLEQYKTVKYSSEYEFEQYILEKFGN